MSKNPFELRFNALELARVHLLEEYNAQIETVRIMQSLDMPQSIPYGELVRAKFPTIDDIFALAERMRGFIDG